jgi:hypothetical protein
MVKKHQKKKKKKRQANSAQLKRAQQKTGMQSTEAEPDLDTCTKVILKPSP